MTRKIGWAGGEPNDRSLCFLSWGRKGSIPSNIVWSPLVPVKVGFFALKVTSGKDSELDLFQKSGSILLNECYMCRSDQ